jgi:phosphopantothenoylcysteine decarboxylase / phosphopantothenate---cysteine ligase
MTPSSEKPLVVLGVTGCIAAYKACELARTLMRAECRVKVVMTEAATRFVGPTTFRALTDEPVAVGLWDEADARVHHVSLAEEADVFAVVPATANTLAKLACGRADDLLSTTALATEATLVLAPAMNVHMWRADATRTAVDGLRARGAVVIAPETGELACGDVGEGRLAGLDRIAEVIIAEARRTRDLEGVGVLVTAGPTREAIDPVRFLSNASSGKTGYAIADEAARRGARVTLVSGPTTLPDPFGVHTVRVTTAEQMRVACVAAYPECDVLVAAAAVSDFRPAEPHAHKQAKGSAGLVIETERTADILAELAGQKAGRFVIGFAAQTREVLSEASRKLAEKQLDAIVANDVSESGLGFSADENRVWLVTADAVEEMPVMSKTRIAAELWERFAPSARRAAELRRKGDVRETPAGG